MVYTIHTVVTIKQGQIDVANANQDLSSGTKTTLQELDIAKKNANTYK